MPDLVPQWAAVVPVKGGPQAKSRLALPGAARSDLANAFARDTVAAVIEALEGMPVLVVTSDPAATSWVATGGARLVPDPGLGLDAAVAAGCRVAAGDGATRIAVVLGDHPALRAADVRVALEAAGRHPAAVVPDADGLGTAMLTLTVREGESTAAVRTAFGAGSAAAHEALGHVRLDLDLPGLRVDVDDARSLAQAVRLGLGPHTTRALARATVHGVQATIHRIADDGSGSALLDDGVEVDLPPDAAQRSGLRHLRVGQRVSIELDESGAAATRVWITGIGPGEDIH
ncbi:hypothetical protein GCM10023153_17610 [Ornithinibacter aureus]|uniref:Phosphoenolpyruvate guanylyltransferase n=1 Tax=Ornithinibacter aureus TaxID=622664 RepID=A0ABP8JSM2_9MICO|nr:2-phospho-L-lactate guanylyltransferase [Ornithinibacter aureus]KAF0833363.1 2-phospho-L-lactate guanylyltransferase [Ornithinibacter aureus]